MLRRSNHLTFNGRERDLVPPKELNKRGFLIMNARATNRYFQMKLSLCLGVALLGCTVLASAQSGYKFDAATVSGLPARNIGSAAMSGRVAAIDAVEQDGRITVFVGAASGGVWKSVN